MSSLFTKIFVWQSAGSRFGGIRQGSMAVGVRAIASLLLGGSMTLLAHSGGAYSSSDDDAFMLCDTIHEPKIHEPAGARRAMFADIRELAQLKDVVCMC